MEQRAEQKLKELLAFAKKHSLAEMVWQEKELRVAFRRNLSRVEKGSAPKATVPRVGPVQPIEVKKENFIPSPLVGTFRRSLSKDRPPLVLEGTKVKPGDRVGVVECMKIPTEVISYAEGTITKVLIEDGQVVEYGQPLFNLSADAGNGHGPNGKK